MACYKKQQSRQPYDAHQAQQRAAVAKKRTPYKLKGPLLTIILTRLRDRLSPEQICGELQRVTAKRKLHHETIYRYIYRHQKLTAQQDTEHEELTQYLRIRHRSSLPVKTITFDNGLEFARHESIGRALEAATYFAHPYHSCGPPVRERGLNENTNGLIRQYIPKDCPISIVRPTDVSWLEDQLNPRPRKSLAYLSLAEFTQNELYALQM